MSRSKSKGYRWDVDTTRRLIASYAAKQKLPKLRPNQNLWQGVFEDLFQGQKTECNALMCKWRFTRLRGSYKAMRQGKIPKANITKFYRELDELFADEEIVTADDTLQIDMCDTMCRCCGQLTTGLTNLNLTIESADDGDLTHWFFAFTGLQPDSVCQRYTKICDQCRVKLSGAHKFREQCLMAEQMFQQETSKEQSIKTEKVGNDGKRTKRVRKRQTKPSQNVAECVTCNKVFSNNKGLAMHLKNHSKVNRHKCPICDKAYSNLSGLRLHQATHDESLKRFQCATCGEKFPTAVYLRYHMDRHTDTRPFICKTCGKSYHRSHALNHHIRSYHENVKYACDECTEVYARPQRLKIHILLEHKGAVLRCSVCPLESQNRSKFVKHLRNVHQTGFNQSIHVILADTNEKLVRRRKLDESLIQTEKIVVANIVELKTNEAVDDT